MAIVRRSEKRDAILQLLQSTDCHPSADWVYHQLKDKYPGLSLGTVYRNLAQLAEEGYIFSVGTVKDQERYDAQLKPHAHFVCTGCGQIIDLPEAPVPQEYVDAQITRFGIAVTQQEFTLRGLCKDCRK